GAHRDSGGGEHRAEGIHDLGETVDEGPAGSLLEAGGQLEHLAFRSAWMELAYDQGYPRRLGHVRFPRRPAFPSRAATSRYRRTCAAMLSSKVKREARARPRAAICSRPSEEAEKRCRRSASNAVSKGGSRNPWTPSCRS